MWTWGANTNGQLGDGATVTRAAPGHVSGPSLVEWIAAGAAHSLAVERGGAVWAWGDNADGQLGDGTTTRRTLPTPNEGLDGAVALAAGGRHSLTVID